MYVHLVLAPAQPDVEYSMVAQRDAEQGEHKDSNSAPPPSYSEVTKQDEAK